MHACKGTVDVGSSIWIWVVYEWQHEVEGTVLHALLLARGGLEGSSVLLLLLCCCYCLMASQLHCRTPGKCNASGSSRGKISCKEQHKQEAKARSCNMHTAFNTSTSNDLPALMLIHHASTGFQQDQLPIAPMVLLAAPLAVLLPYRIHSNQQQLLPARDIRLLQVPAANFRPLIYTHLRLNLLT
jgi:hypothetical protein